MKYTVNKANTFQRKGEFLKVGASIDMPEDGAITAVYLAKKYVTLPEAKKPKDSGK